MNNNNYVGTCPRCGAPIYQFAGIWNAVIPPPLEYTCNCFSSRTYTTTSNRETTLVPTLDTLRNDLTKHRFDDASFVSGVETALDYVFLLMEREQLSNAAKVIDDIETEHILDFFVNDVYPYVEK